MMTDEGWVGCRARIAVSVPAIRQENRYTGVKIRESTFTPKIAYFYS